MFTTLTSIILSNLLGTQSKCPTHSCFPVRQRSGTTGHVTEISADYMLSAVKRAFEISAEWGPNYSSWIKDSGNWRLDVMFIRTCG